MAHLLSSVGVGAIVVAVWTTGQRGPGGAWVGLNVLDAFLKLIDGQVPKGLDVHLVLDNYGTHNHPNVKAWLDKHRRFHLHFTPMSSSWLNLVERWFRELTDKAIRSGVFPSVDDLVATIDD